MQMLRRLVSSMVARSSGGGAVEFAAMASSSRSRGTSKCCGGSSPPWRLRAAAAGSPRRHDFLLKVAEDPQALRRLISSMEDRSGGGSGAVGFAAAAPEECLLLDERSLRRRCGHRRRGPGRGSAADGLARLLEVTPWTVAAAGARLLEASVLCVCWIIRVSGYSSGFVYPRVSGLRMNSQPNSSLGRVRVSILGVQTLHPNRTRPVATPTAGGARRRGMSGAAWDSGADAGHGGSGGDPGRRGRRHRRRDISVCGKSEEGEGGSTR